MNKKQITDNMKMTLKKKGLDAAEKLRAVKEMLNTLPCESSIESKDEGYIRFCKSRGYIDYIARARRDFYIKKNIDGALHNLSNLIYTMPPYYLPGRIALTELIDDFLKEYKATESTT